MVNMWLPGAEHHPLDFAPMNGVDLEGEPDKFVTAHITWDKNATRANPIKQVPFDDLVHYFTGAGRGVAPHFLWCPFTGRIAQFFPANSRSKSLEDPVATNRRGKYNIQIEADFFPFCIYSGHVYEHLTDTPCRNYDKIVTFTEQLGIPSVFPKGFPNGTSQRSEVRESGWYGHSQWDHNHHTDPLTWPHFPKKVHVPNVVPYFPGRAYFHVGAYNKYVVDVDKNLIRLGFTRHNDGDGYQAGPRYTEYTRLNVRDFQLSRKDLAGDPDGLVGPLTWRDLFISGR